jgi:regulator of nucleoside diphosphate kinase
MPFRPPQLFLVEAEAARLRDLVLQLRHTGGRALQPNLDRLQAELDRAETRPADAVPPDVVTMGSSVVVTDLDTGDEQQFTLVWPEEADSDARRISVLAPIGTALLGFRRGDEVEWPVPAGVRRFRLARVEHPAAKV